MSLAKYCTSVSASPCSSHISACALAPSPYLLQPMGCLQRMVIKRLTQQRVERKYRVQENNSARPVWLFAWVTASCWAWWGRTGSSKSLLSFSFSSSSLEISLTLQNRKLHTWKREGGREVIVFLFAVTFLSFILQTVVTISSTSALLPIISPSLTLLKNSASVPFSCYSLQLVQHCIITTPLPKCITRNLQVAQLLWTCVYLPFL